MDSNNKDILNCSYFKINSGVIVTLVSTVALIFQSYLLLQQTNLLAQQNSITQDQLKQSIYITGIQEKSNLIGKIYANNCIYLADKKELSTKEAFNAAVQALVKDDDNATDLNRYIASIKCLETNEQKKTREQSLIDYIDLERKLKGIHYKNGLCLDENGKSDEINLNSLFFSSSTFYNVNFSCVNFNRAFFSNVEFRNSDLRGAHMFASETYQVEFYESNLERSNLTNIHKK